MLQHKKAISVGRHLLANTAVSVYEDTTASITSMVQIRCNNSNVTVCCTSKSSWYSRIPLYAAFVSCKTSLSASPYLSFSKLHSAESGLVSHLPVMQSYVNQNIWIFKRYAHRGLPICCVQWSKTVWGKVNEAIQYLMLASFVVDCKMQKKVTLRTEKKKHILRTKNLRSLYQTKIE